LGAATNPNAPAAAAAAMLASEVKAEGRAGRKRPGGNLTRLSKDSHGTAIQLHLSKVTRTKLSDINATTALAC
jgi:hypothetical protein